MKQVIQPGSSVAQPGSRARQWRKHDGSHLPIEASGPVDVEFRDGDVSTVRDGQSLGGWIHSGQHTDVMAFRVHRDDPAHRPPRTRDHD